MSDAVPETCACVVSCACLADRYAEEKLRGTCMLVDELQNSSRVEKSRRGREPDGCRVTAPPPGLWLFGQSSPNGIQGDVHDGRGQVLVGSDPLRVEAAVEQISFSFVSLVEVSGVRGQEPLHPDPEVRRRCTD